MLFGAAAGVPDAASAQGQEAPRATSAVEPDDTVATRLSPVVVSATRSIENAAAIPGSVSVIERPEIEAQAPVSTGLADLLGKIVPGLAPGSQTNTNSGQTLRGRNVLVLIDGVPQNTTRNVTRDLFTIDPSAIERIEVIRGATAVYGNGGAGGIINIITRAPGTGAPRFTTSVGGEMPLSALRTDSIGGRFEQGVSGRTGRFDYAASLGLEPTGSFFDARGDRIPPEPSQGDLADTNRYDVLGKLGMELDEAQRLQLTFNRLDAQQDSNYASDPAVNRSAPGTVKARAIEGLSLADQPETQNTVVSLDYVHKDVFGSRVDAQLYWRDYFTRFFPFDGRSLAAWRSVAQTRLESETYGGRLGIDTPFSALREKDVSVVWGIDYSHELSAQPVSIFDPAAFDASGGKVFIKTGDRTFAPPVLNESIGLFAQGEWKLGEQWILRAGLRHERIRIEVEDFVTLGAGARISGGSAEFSDTVYNAGAVFAATKAIDLFANFSQGFSVPDVGLILRGAPAGFTISAATLRPLKVDNYELGIRGNWKSVQSSFSVFYSTSDLGATSNGFTATVVRAPERVYGFEATLDLELLPAWRLGGTYTWLEGENDPDLDGNYTPLNGFRIPPMKLTAYLEHDPLPGWRNRIQVLYSGNRDRAFDAGVGFGGQKIDDYVTVDLISAFDIGPGTLKLGVQNLLNEQYFTTFAQLLPSGHNASHVAARGTVLNATYSLAW
jgi:iron complex outermembrane receptor protein